MTLLSFHSDANDADEAFLILLETQYKHAQGRQAKVSLVLSSEVFWTVLA